MSDLVAFLEPRLARVPAALADRIRQSSARTTLPPGPFPLRLRLERLAQILLDQARRGKANRETAITLLAADALITYACESIAESSPADLAELQ